LGARAGETVEEALSVRGRDLGPGVLDEAELDLEAGARGGLAGQRGRRRRFRGRLDGRNDGLDGPRLGLDGPRLGLDGPRLGLDGRGNGRDGPDPGLRRGAWRLEASRLRLLGGARRLGR